MGYVTTYTFEQLIPEQEVDTRIVLANCNAITFRALYLTTNEGHAFQGQGVIESVLWAPDVEGIKLLPGMLQNVYDNQVNPGVTVSNEYLLQTAPEQLHFDAGHPESKDMTKYTVTLRRDSFRPVASVMVIRRYITRV